MAERVTFVKNHLFRNSFSKEFIINGVTELIKGAANERNRDIELREIVIWRGVLAVLLHVATFTEVKPGEACALNFLSVMDDRSVASSSRGIGVVDVHTFPVVHISPHIHDDFDVLFTESTKGNAEVYVNLIFPPVRSHKIVNAHLFGQSLEVDPIFGSPLERFSGGMAHEGNRSKSNE
jgi:hypothetical protein